MDFVCAAHMVASLVHIGASNPLVTQLTELRLRVSDKNIKTDVTQCKWLVLSGWTCVLEAEIKD